MVSLECRGCGQPFKTHPAWLRRTAAPSCSRKCYAKAQRERIIKQCKVCHKPFDVRPSEASKFSTCERKRCRSKSGEKNANWRGGIAKGRPERSTNKYKAWRKAVFERDDYTCQKCWVRGGDLHADHIKPWAYFKKLRYELSNGRTLCVDCHRGNMKSVFTWRKKAA